jgi:hypothetical protein
MDIYDIQPTDPDLCVHISDVRPLKVKIDLFLNAKNFSSVLI